MPTAPISTKKIIEICEEGLRLDPTDAWLEDLRALAQFASRLNEETYVTIDEIDAGRLRKSIGDFDPTPH